MKSEVNEDRQLKVLLALIALALFANALNPWLQPPPVAAQQPPADLPMMEVHLRNMDQSMGGMANDLEQLVAVVTRLEGGSGGDGQCSWTLVDDVPTTGANGQIQATGDWAAVSSGGWSLRAVHDDGYVFERCR